MTHQHQTTRLGGGRQHQLSHGSGPCRAFAAQRCTRTTRVSGPQRSSHSAVIPNQFPDLETPVSTKPGRNEGAATQRRTASQMLAAICDPDQRSTNPDLRRLAAAVPAGQPVPDPERTRSKYQAFISAADCYLADQPTARTTRAAGLHLQRTLIGLVNDVAGRKAC